MPLVRSAGGWNYQYVMMSPGEMLAEEFLKPLGLSQNQLAMSIHVPTTRIGEIVRGKRAIIPDTALRLARFFDNSPEFWLNLQQMHDLSKARLDLTKSIEAEVPVYEPNAAELKASCPNGKMNDAARVRLLTDVQTNVLASGEWLRSTLR